MVRVIDATPHPNVVKRAICRNCGVSLEYVPRDVKKYTERDYGGGSDTYHYIDCAACADRVYVKLS
jgi:hypothetical protein